MSELIQKHDSRATIRWKLLTGASALALAAYAASPSIANAEDAGQPVIWIELGGQAEHATGQGQPFAPDFLANFPDSTVLWKGVTPIEAQKLPYLGFGESGKISFQPENSDWVFSAAIRYGRSSSSRHVHHQTGRVFDRTFPSALITTDADFSDTKTNEQEHHAVLDFSAGKDVGLGLFGHDGSSILSVGVRFAQFASKSSIDMKARPTMDVSYFSYAGVKLFPLVKFNNYYVTGHASRDFHGVGPSISWTASAPIAGNSDSGEISLDWGANAALLFGKQKAHVHHQQSASYHHYFYLVTLYSPRTGGHDNVRSVTVPNVGAFAGVTFRYAEAKVSFGYRADLFMNVMDTGIDKRNSSNVLFHGPYASISIGLGD